MATTESQRQRFREYNAKHRHSIRERKRLAYKTKPKKMYSCDHCRCVVRGESVVSHMKSKKHLRQFEAGASQVPEFYGIYRPQSNSTTILPMALIETIPADATAEEINKKHIEPELGPDRPFKWRQSID